MAASRCSFSVVLPSSRCSSSSCWVVLRRCCLPLPLLAMFVDMKLNYRHICPVKLSKVRQIMVNVRSSKGGVVWWFTSSQFSPFLNWLVLVLLSHPPVVWRCFRFFGWCCFILPPSFFLRCLFPVLPHPSLVGGAACLHHFFWVVLHSSFFGL